MICPKCGKNVGPGLLFCTNCGSKLDQKQSNIENNTNHTSENKNATKTEVVESKEIESSNDKTDVKPASSVGCLTVLVVLGLLIFLFSIHPILAVIAFLIICYFVGKNTKT